MARLPIVHHAAYDARDVPDGHRFPMRKFSQVAARLVSDGLVTWDTFVQPAPAPASWVEMAHARAYVDQVFGAAVEPARARRIGFPMTEAVGLRARCATAGTVLSAHLALEAGAACNTAGGSHHADYDGGAGFCVFNDVAVAAALLLADAVVRQVLVIDLDVHQGDGTARIFAAEPRVFTYSVHAEKNFPHRKAVSDLDRPLASGTQDAGYLACVEADLSMLLTQVKPELVFYVAGVDPHKEDRLGLLSLSDAGLQARDAMVARAVVSSGAALVGVLGGGYSPDLDDLARRHTYLHHAAAAALNERAAR